MRFTAPVATISGVLGFDAATNVMKFFRRETGRTPAAFRAGHALGQRRARSHGAGMLAAKWRRRWQVGVRRPGRAVR